MTAFSAAVFHDVIIIIIWIFCNERKGYLHGSRGPQKSSDTPPPNANINIFSSRYIYVELAKMAVITFIALGIHCTNIAI